MTGRIASVLVKHLSVTEVKFAGASITMNIDYTTSNQPTSPTGAVALVQTALLAQALGRTVTVSLNGTQITEIRFD